MVHRHSRPLLASYLGGGGSEKRLQRAGDTHLPQVVHCAQLGEGRELEEWDGPDEHVDPLSQVARSRLAQLERHVFVEDHGKDDVSARRTASHPRRAQ